VVINSHATHEYKTSQNPLEIQQPIHAETNYSGLVKSLRSGGKSIARWAGIIDEIINISNLLPACKFEHIRREANKVAHQPARRGLEKKEWVVMHHAMPKEIRSLVLAKTTGVLNSSFHCNPISSN
jgi:hypothetical protein